MLTPLMAVLSVAASRLPLAAEPLPMNDVTLTGDWAHAQQRNLDTLLSLNMSRWACHFTTTANLTSCTSTNVPWHTYIKGSPPTNFTLKRGFLTGGDDARPPSTTKFAECESVCASDDKCLGFTFQAEAAAPVYAPVKCYWKSAVHFVPENHRTNCVAMGGAGKPACTPLPGEMGLGGYYGHYQGHWLSATSFLVNQTANATVKRAADAAIATLATVMEAWKAAYGEDGYLFPYSPVVWDKLLAGHGAGPWYSVPFYTLHKLMAGLLDQYIYAHSTAALGLVTRMAAWVSARVDRVLASGGEALWQRVLLTEWGGMNDVLYELYEHTGDPAHLATGRRFNAYVRPPPQKTHTHAHTHTSRLACYAP